MLVRATNKYKELNLKDNELGRIPEEGEKWEVTDERLKILTGNNNYNTTFVEIVEDEIEINEEDIVDNEKLNEDEIIKVEAKKVNITKKKTTRKKK